ncbi:hypothetical protein L1987_17436 [Smallanthus sonchifolius]|uniref:Uncharacterized protein n=1 Tax=Smallanthus sonchifolius TaxID=185202 RepID=A0ACB9IWU0_9ASTR|nr:hypothetical protein L1987_17436 [Smallanthus sonchifolius]
MNDDSTLQTKVFCLLFDGHLSPTISLKFSILVSWRLIGESCPQFFCGILSLSQSQIHSLGANGKSDTSRLRFVFDQSPPDISRFSKDG